MGPAERRKSFAEKKVSPPGGRSQSNPHGSAEKVEGGLWSDRAAEKTLRLGRGKCHRRRMGKKLGKEDLLQRKGDLEKSRNQTRKKPI